MPRTDIALDPLAAMPRHKQLWTVEQLFRTANTTLGTRPIFRRHRRQGLPGAGVALPPVRREIEPAAQS